jgi:hypothetical protein
MQAEKKKKNKKVRFPSIFLWSVCVAVIVSLIDSSRIKRGRKRTRRKNLEKWKFWFNEWQILPALLGHSPFNKS